MGYTNSKLAKVTILSPNNSGTRKNPISIISPHCVVGHCTAESLGKFFSSSSRKASSNYGIGKDGSIGLYVPESKRSWCTSSSWNDNRAVTIECSSDSTAPYAFKDATYNALIELCADICKRNGKNKLIWFGDKDKTLNYTPKSNEMLLTVHRWFANKSCPGDWMYNKMGDLASKVTNKLQEKSKDKDIETKKDNKTKDTKDAKEKNTNNKTLKVGSLVKIKKGAKTYSGTKLASYVYDWTLKVKEISKDKKKAVVTHDGVVIASVKTSDLIIL